MRTQISPAFLIVLPIQVSIERAGQLHSGSLQEPPKKVTIRTLGVNSEEFTVDELACNAQRV